MPPRSVPMVLAFVVAAASPALAGAPERAPQAKPSPPRLGDLADDVTPPHPAPSQKPPVRHAQPVPPDADPAAGTPAAADAPMEPTASPPADTTTEPVQSFGEEPAAAADPQAAQRPPEDVQSFAEATMVSTGPIRFALNAFGDASFRANVPEEGDDSRTFSLGTLALLINARLGGHIIGTAETAFDANRDNVQAVKLERLHIRFQNQHWFVVGGRMHSDIGYWNTAYHHGPWLQLPIGRPRGVRGETSGGILPIHWIGVEGGLILPVEPSTLTVSAGIGNGRGRDEANIRLTNDSNNFKALKLKVELLGLGWPDLRVGASGLYDRIAAEPMEVRPALPDAEIDEVIGNVFVAYRGVSLTFIAEGFAIWHMADDDTFTTTDAYAVAGYRVGRITPYVQIERTDALKGVDPYFTPVPGMPTPSTPEDLSELILGTRLDTSVWSALKGEYSIVRHDDDKAIDHTVTVNWSFGI